MPARTRIEGHNAGAGAPACETKQSALSLRRTPTEEHVVAAATVAPASPVPPPISSAVRAEVLLSTTKRSLPASDEDGTCRRLTSELPTAGRQADPSHCESVSPHAAATGDDRSALLREIQGGNFALRQVATSDGSGGSSDDVDGRRCSASDGAVPCGRSQIKRGSSYHDGILRDVRKVLDAFHHFLADDPDSDAGSDWSDGE